MVRKETRQMLRKQLQQLLNCSLRMFKDKIDQDSFYSAGIPAEFGLNMALQVRILSDHSWSLDMLQVASWIAQRSFLLLIVISSCGYQCNSR